MDCAHCRGTLHEGANFCHHCGQPLGHPPPLSGGRTLLCVAVASVSLPALAFGGCFTMFGAFPIGLPVGAIGLGGLYVVWKLVR